MPDDKKPSDDRPKTILPENLSFLAPPTKHARHGLVGRSLLLRGVWWLVGPAMTLMLLSSVAALVMGIAAWVFTPDWLKAAGFRLLKTTVATEANDLLDWSNNQLEQVKAVVEQVSEEPTPEQPPVAETPPQTAELNPPQN